MHLFPRLFAISNHMNCSVGEVVNGREGEGSWNLVWRRELFVWEGALLGEGRDKWLWRPEGGRAFSVNSYRKLLERLFLIEDNLSGDEECVFGGLWKCRAPSKVLAFA